ncbi:hypothetical protein [Thermodesulfobacterium thermophilum]|uniref:hypothetical protein n=1 Tax=Thermodesulfobacterium thermophilum TaxID=886 RepID=UPI0012DE9D37|nr:hypothetical protein [Thermodesulfobacterium thermophilum]
MKLLRRPVIPSGRKHFRPTKPFEGTVAEFACHVWAGDFIHDRLVSGRAFRVFNVVDIFTRRAFEPIVDYSLTGRAVAEHLDKLCRLYGPLKVFRREVSLY